MCYFICYAFRSYIHEIILELGGGVGMGVENVLHGRTSLSTIFCFLKDIYLVYIWQNVNFFLVRVMGVYNIICILCFKNTFSNSKINT